MQRLSEERLAKRAPSVRVPQYDRASLKIGMAHIGVGAFHRCHQIEYADDMLEAKFGPWGVLGVNLRLPRLAGLLGPQDCLFSRTLRQDARAETRILGAMRRVIDIEDDASAETAIASLAERAIAVATMTVTEKGYCLTPSTGALDRGNPDLSADFKGAFPPRTVLGLLALALERRRRSGAGGLTLVSCDNIPSNGVRLRAALLEFAAAQSAELSRWVEDNVAFPGTMVDRIVPATTVTDVENVSAAIGMRDEAAVIGEPFRQWVIEDNFAAGRPPWDLAGAQFVPDAKPYELIKMRVLNAAQSTLSHQGAIVGHEFSFEAAADPVLSVLARRMLERETAATLPNLAGMDVAPYIDSSLTRIRNAAIRHRCHQIGTDGSQKIVQRLLGPLRDCLALGRRADLLILAVASWMAYCLAGAIRFGARWKPSDPWAETIAARGDGIADFRRLAKSILSIEPIFGTDLVRPQIADPVARHLAGLLEGDPRAYLAERANNDWP